MQKTGFIAIVGRPNVGKSTLLNSVLGEKIAIVSSKPQTTRNRITGILTRGDEQFVFLDTPGLHRPRNKLGSYMVKAANDSMYDADAVVLVAQAGMPCGDIEKNVLDYVRKSGTASMLVLNKTDLCDREKIAQSISEYAALHDFNAVIPMSARKGDMTADFLDECSGFLNEGEHFFPDDIITDQPERKIASEIIREKLLRTLDKEIPHGVAVVIEEFKDEGSMVSIRAEIFCEKASHKGIIVGKNGAALKLAGTYAREELERFLGVKVYLNLWVKVKENWRDSAGLVANFGYKNDDNK